MVRQYINPIQLAQNLAKQFATRAEEADRVGRLPAEDVSALKDSGYLTLSIPKEYGGYGLTLHECVQVHLELARGSSSSAMVAGMQLHIFGQAAEAGSWAQEQYAHLCELALSGAMFNTLASEPQLGSPSRGGLPATSAVVSEDGLALRISGHKTWCTGGQYLTHFLLTAQLAENSVLVLVPNNLQGIEWSQSWQDSLSFRASESHDLYLHNVTVPKSNILRTNNNVSLPNAWFPMIMSSVYLGTALAARDALISHCLERTPTALGQAIATLPKIQRQIGEIDLALQAARALFFEATAAWTGDTQQRRRVYPRLVAAKHLITETANEITDKALRVAGGLSLTKALPLERHFRDVRAGLMQPPSGDTALEIIGQSAITELSA